MAFSLIILNHLLCLCGIFEHATGDQSKQRRTKGRLLQMFGNLHFGIKHSLKNLHKGKVFPYSVARANDSAPVGLHLTIHFKEFGCHTLKHTKGQLCGGEILGCEP